MRSQRDVGNEGIDPRIDANERKFLGDGSVLEPARLRAGDVESLSLAEEKGRAIDRGLRG